jgi:uncharacterized protein (TIGR03067 family)
MYLRLLIVLLVVTGLTAFAPAPFPRPKRDNDQMINLDRFQGTWKVISLETTGVGGRHTRINWSITHIRIAQDRWTFLQNRIENTTYQIALDPGQKPCTIDYRWPGNQGGQPAMVGIIRRKGDRVDIVYLSGTNRPRNLDDPPPNFWLLKLVREK